MPGITNPAEEYFKDGTWAWNPAGGVWLKLIIDPLTNRLVIDHPGDIEVVQPVPNDLRVGNYGWDGAAWRKLPLVWGYSDRWTEEKTNAAAGAGDASCTTTAVAAGYVYVLQQVSLYHTADAANQISCRVKNGAMGTYLHHNLTAAPDTWHPWTGEMCMVEGDTVAAVLIAPGDGKALYLNVWGYKMKIAE